MDGPPWLEPADAACVPPVPATTASAAAATANMTVSDIHRHRRTAVTLLVELRSRLKDIMPLVPGTGR